MTTQAEALAAFGRVLAVTRDERDRWYAEGGAQAVAQHAAGNGTPQRRAQIAAHYESLREQGASAA